MSDRSKLKKNLRFLLLPSSTPLFLGGLSLSLPLFLCSLSDFVQITSGTYTVSCKSYFSLISVTCSDQIVNFPFFSFFFQRQWLSKFDAEVWAQAAMGATEKMMEVMGTSHVLSRIQQVVVDSKRRNKLLEIANEIARINPNDKSYKQ